MEIFRKRAESGLLLGSDYYMLQNDKIWVLSFDIGEGPLQKDSNQKVIIQQVKHNLGNEPIHLNSATGMACIGLLKNSPKYNNR